MARRNIGFEMIHIENPDRGWPNDKANAIVSVILSYTSVIIGGFGLYAFFNNWKSFPLIGIAWILWGISCVGLRRLSTPRGDVTRPDTNN